MVPLFYPIEDLKRQDPSWFPTTGLVCSIQCWRWTRRVRASDA